MEMNLTDMLSYADIHDLSGIARTYECECNGHSKNDLIQAILSAALRKEVFERHVQSLDLADIRFLNSLLFDQRNAFSMEELIARVGQSYFSSDEDKAKQENEPCNPREIILKFKKLGWLFNGYSQQTKYLFHVPHDLKKRFHDVLTSQFKAELQTTGEPRVYRDEQTLIADDVSHFLSYLAEQQEVALTSDGTLYKRQLQQILDCLSVQEQMAPKGAWRFGYGRMFKEYPNRFSLIYDYCYYNQLITEHMQTLRLTEAGKARIQDGRKENPAAIYRFWLRLYKNPIPNVQMLVQWIDRLAGQWVTEASLGKVLCQLIKPFYYDSPESILEQRILQMMLHLGLVRIGEDEAKGKVVQVTKLGGSVIQGTFVSEDDKVVMMLDQHGAIHK